MALDNNRAAILELAKYNKPDETISKYIKSKNPIHFVVPHISYPIPRVEETRVQLQTPTSKRQRIYQQYSVSLKQFNIVFIWLIDIHIFVDHFLSVFIDAENHF